MGFSLDALFAGRIPKIIPMAAENAKASRAGRAHYGYKLSRLHLQIDLSQGNHRMGAGPVHFTGILHLVTIKFYINLSVIIVEFLNRLLEN